jgi:hypothetical protein
MGWLKKTAGKVANAAVKPAVNSITPKGALSFALNPTRAVLGQEVNTKSPLSIADYMGDPLVYETAKDYILKKHEDPSGNLPDININGDINDARNKLLNLANEAYQREQQYKSGVVNAATAQQQAVDQQLSSLIDKTGFQTGLNKGAIGANMAERGMTRSGMNVSALAGEDLRQNQAVGTLKANAGQMKADIQQGAYDAQQQVLNRRREIESKLAATNLSSLQDVQFQKQAQQISMDYGNVINNLQTSADNKQAMMGLLGGIGGVAGTAGGYYAAKGMNPSSPTIDQNIQNQSLINQTFA